MTHPDAGEPSDAAPGDGIAPEDADAAQDADVSEPPPECTPGERRSVPCERCGLSQETCGSDGGWARTSECLAQRTCEDGTVEREPLPLCGERTRLCTAECDWTAWETTTPSRVCNPGSNRNAEPPFACELGTVAIQRCDDGCEWSRPVCVPPCSLTRHEPWDAVEVCIPEGPFVRGHRTLSYVTPQVDTFMSTFLIDQYPVTNRRYLECVDAGVCTEPLDFRVLRDPEQLRRPVLLATRDQATAFCNWDGGRLPISQAEWEKAAKGPAPRDPSYPWGEEPAGCAPPVFSDCPGFVLRQTADGLPYDVDAFPEWNSFYGVSMLVTAGETVTRERLDLSFHARSLGDPNPVDDSPGEPFATRGPRPFRHPVHQHMSAPTDAVGGTIRCVRRFD